MNVIDMVNNGWFVGIVGGIVSGVIVYFITSFFVNKKDKKFYKEKLNLGNLEVLNSLKPMVTDEITFNSTLYRTVSRAIATKHGVNQADLYNFTTVTEIITAEIMQSQFLSYEQKKQYSQTLTEAIEVEENRQKSEKEETPVKVLDTSSVSKQNFSLITAMLASTVALLATMLISQNFKLNEAMYPLYLMFLVVPFMVIIMVQLIFLTERQRKRARLAQEEKLQQQRRDLIENVYKINENL